MKCVFYAFEGGSKMGAGDVGNALTTEMTNVGVDKK